MCDPATLNEKFSIPGVAEFTVGAHGAVVANISNAGGSASIARQGAQLLSWAPTGQAPVVWLSPAARFTAGKSLRGGTPVCWPWFGAHSTDASKPAHGFARNLDWRVVEVTALGAATRVVLSFVPEAEQHALWPYAAELKLAITVGSRLRMELSTHNTGTKPLTLTQALHTYFHVGDIGSVAVEGLEGKAFIDRVQGDARRNQQGPITIDSEVDRIYLDAPGEVAIVDRALDRRILIGKQNSNSYVVWNPWAEKGAKFGDMGDDGYRRMLCVETTNAWDDTVTVAPGETITLSTEYRVEALL
ncbi:MAG: D-hexose-6-phosphate mutarotase [Thiotrichales bacterium]